MDGGPGPTGVTTYSLQHVTAERWIGVSFAPDVYTIQASAGAHGSVSPTGAVQVVYGDNQSSTTTPEAAYEVAFWLLDGQPAQTNENSFLLTNVQSNHTLQVTFSTPVLSIALTATNSVRLSWPDPSTDYVLQESASLNAANWTNNTATPAVVGSHKQAIVSRPSGQRFYRLLKP